MEKHYLYETFKSESADFDKTFTDYLNEKRSNDWKVKDCSFCHDSDKVTMWSSCLFKHKH